MSIVISGQREALHAREEPIVGGSGGMGSDSALFVKEVGGVEIVEPSLHEDELGISVGSIMGLSAFNSFVEEANSLVVFFLQLGLDALVLHVLKTIHPNRVGLPHQALILVTSGAGIGSLLGHLLLLQKFLLISRESNVIFIKDNSLDIMGREVP
jgi:hypothetical protein